jgi:transposase
MSDRDVLTDDMWARLEPLLPERPSPRGRPSTDHRLMLEAIIWRFRTGSPWRDLPERFPSFKTVWNRFNAWSQDGTLEKILRVLQGQEQADGHLGWTVSVDSTIARAHQHAAGARQGGAAPPEDPPGDQKGGPVGLQEFLAGAR